MAGFHQARITKGVLGELSKVREELEEAEDAAAQGQKLMLLIELADIVGAVELVAQRNGATLDDLVAYARLRARVGTLPSLPGGP